MLKQFVISLMLFFISFGLFAQRGKNNSPNITTANVIVNDYTALIANANAGALSISVASNLLNGNPTYLPGNLSAGDLIMIIQMQGVSVNGVMSGFGNSGSPNDTAWGRITSFNNCGNYELAQVSSVSNTNTINLDCGLKNSYTSSGKVQVIRVPRFNSLTVGAAGSITGAAWNGTTGGVVAIEVLNNTILNNTTASILATGLGFRGGTPATDNSSVYGAGGFSHTNAGEGAEKGESVYGWLPEYDIIGGRYCKGAIANAGGGGNAHNAAGGGGANAGDVALWKGTGNPQSSTAFQQDCWNLELAGLASSTSSGGGRGGYTFSSSAKDPSLVVLGDPSWGGDNRKNAGGIGGRPLDYSTGKIFLGGGGGGGDEDNNVGGDGGNGGGIIYLMSYGDISGSGKIVANGNNGQSTQTTNCRDGSGGGGAGGTVLLNSVGNITGISIDANGGIGGSQNFGTGFNGFETEGPGGGGGGGYIAVSNGTVTKNVNGGINGTTNSTLLNVSATKTFPQNGATKGGDGINSGTLSNFTIQASDAVTCPGGTVTLSASLAGTAPSGATIEWYATAAGGVSIASGNTYITPVITGPTTYYVGTCPGTYRVPVNITLSGGAVADAGNDITICGGSSVTLNGSGGVSCLWSFDSSLSDSTICNPVATPVTNTNYILTVTDINGCKDRDTVTVSIGSGLAFNLSNDTTICEGSSLSLIASSATGGVTFTWSPSTDLSSNTGDTVTAVLSSTDTIYCTADNGLCSSVDSVIITVQPSYALTVTPSAPAICSGDSVLLVASNSLGTSLNYIWSGIGLLNNNNDSVIVNPSSSTNYSVSADSGVCSAGAIVVVTVNSKPSIALNTTNVTICVGDTVALSVTGALNYIWSPGTDISSTTDSIVNVYPSAPQVYQVMGTTAEGCTDTLSANINVTPGLNVTVSAASVNICQGASTTLTANGAPNYTWSPAATLSAAGGPSVTATPSSSVTYVVTGTSGSCSDTAMIYINVDTPVSLSVTQSASTICQGDTVNLGASGATAYTWSPATGLNTTNGANVIANPASTQTYTINAANGVCTGTTSITVNVDPAISVYAVASAYTICAGNSTGLVASGAGTYSWTPSASLNSAVNASVTATPVLPTTYIVTGTAGACSDTGIVVIQVNPVPNVSVNNQLVNICSGASATIIANGANTYSWNPAAGISTTSGSTVVVNPSSNNIYTVTGTSSGCSDTAILIVNVNPVPVAAYTFSNDTICVGSCIGFTDNSTISSGSVDGWNWNFGDGNTATLNNITHCYSVAGNYNVTLNVSSSLNCNSTNVISNTVVVSSSPVASFNVIPGDTVYSPGDVITFNNTSSGATIYNWNFGNGETSSSFSTTQTYNAEGEYLVLLTVSGNNGCNDSTATTIKVKKEIPQVIPNVFSPNGDGNNEQFLISGYSINSLKIFNRWGENIYKTTANVWDGTTQGGAAVSDGVYFYILELADGTKKEGYISLVR